MIANLQDASRAALQNEFENHPVWGGPGWKVFLDSRDDIVRTIHYVEQNPVKIRKAVQRWSFVKEYDGWLPGQVRIAKPQVKE